MTHRFERKLHRLYLTPAEKDFIFTGRSTGGSTSLEHVIGVEGTIFNVLLLVVTSIRVG
jgi:hypothetical protein